MALFQNKRQKEIFEAVVRDYIQTGEPVASKALAERYGLNLSAASIRKVLAELESLGLLSQPHTSAGRAPTEHGFKVYADQVLSIKGLPPAVRAAIDKTLAAADGGESSVFALLSKLLTELTSQVGVVMAPLSDKLWLKRMYFIKLASFQILAVLVTENGVIQNRALSPQQDYSQDELNEVNVCLEDIPAPYTLEEIKIRLLTAMGKEKERFEELFQRILTLADEAQKASGDDKETQGDIYIDHTGRERLIEHPDFKDVEAMRSLFRAFENKRRLIELLNEVIGSDRVRVVIGTSDAGADGLALVASPYSVGHHGAGALGILGPRRLNYAEIIPVVEYAARVASSLFGK
jgi:heat-inducible transcriptional repressor